MSEGDRRGGPDAREDRGEGSGRIRYGGRSRSSDPRERSAQRPSDRHRKGDPARRVAYRAMRAIDDGAYTNLDVPARIREAHLSAQDAAFVTELVYGTTRMRGFYDAVIALAADRAVDTIDAETLACMRLGAHQVLSMRVPAHAAVAETVALARGEVGYGPSGFTNAVLRRISERTPGEWIELVEAGVQNEDERLAVRWSHPAWVVRALRSALVGHGAATPDTAGAAVEALLAADNEAAAVSLVARPGLVTVDELVEAGAEASTLSPFGAVLRQGGDPGRISAVRRGRAAVQDEGSQLLPPALVAIELPAREDGAPERWLDMCAGPGGKAGLLAALSLGRDAAVFANEVSEHRARLVEQAVDAALDAGAEVYVGVGDGRTIGEEEPGEYDRVLVDAPCSGLGALRRRPEARWRRVPGDVAELGRLQSELLDSAIAATRPGGVVAYVTCSPHLLETRQTVETALERHPHVTVLDARAHVRDAAGNPVADTGEGPYVQMWPHVHGTDAMFLALLQVGTGPATAEA